MSSNSGKPTCARPIRGPDTRRNQRRKGASPQVVSSCRASEAMDALCGGRRAQYTAEIFSRANRLWLPINRAEPRRCARTTPSHYRCSTQPEPSSSSSSLHFHFPLFSYRGQTTHRSPRRGPHPSIRVAGEHAETSSYLPTPPSWLLPPSTMLTPSSSQPWPPRRAQLPAAVTSTQITAQDTLPVVRGAFPLSPRSPTPLSRMDFELQ